MTTVLLDEHLDGFRRYLEMLTFSDYWREIAQSMQLRFLRLEDVRIANGTSDRDIWRLCQTERYYLLTDNRAQSSADALGAVILHEGTAESLPVFTIGDMGRFRTERSYGDALAKALLSTCLTRSEFRGPGGYLFRERAPSNAIFGRLPPQPT